MGKATRWLKGLLGMKKEKDGVDRSQTRDRKRWSFGGKPAKPDPAASNPRRGEAAWLRSYMSESETEQNKHAIAVAAATAAAADAAVAAAQAAVAVVRLTSRGNGRRDRWAAAKIQAVFRGYLARKALRALRGLVKIQALVRGFLVRKRAAATLHSMQALFRAQTAVRSQRARLSFNKENHPRNSIERFDEPSKRFYEASDESPKIVEVDTYRPPSRSRRYSVALSEYSEDPSSYQTTISSPLPCPLPGRLAVPEFDWCGGECRYATAHSTPRFANPRWVPTPGTPAKSVAGDAVFRPYANSPSYMANTQSFNAKLRSLSAPKQRPEPGSKKRLSLNEILAARNSVSSVRMHRFNEEAFNT